MVGVQAYRLLRKTRAIRTVFLVLLSKLLLEVSSSPALPQCAFFKNSSSITIVCDTESSFPILNFTSTVYDAIVLRGNPKITEVDGNRFMDMMVRSVTLTKTSITDISCDFLNGLEQSLQHLDLRENQLTSIPVCPLRGMKNVTELCLRENKITEIKRDGFSKLFTLTTLDLSCNKIKSITKDSLKDTRLKYLNFSGNSLQGESLIGVFGMLTQLKTLDLSYNLITFVSTAILSSLRSLETLDLGNNGIVYLPETIPLPQLMELSATNNHLNELNNTIFSVSRKIVRLDLSGNDLFRFPSGVQSLSQLELLNLSRNAMSQINQTSSLLSNVIRVVDFSFNNITEVKDILMKACETLEIIFQGNNITKATNITVDVTQSSSYYVTLSFADNNLGKPPSIFVVTDPDYFTTIKIDVSMNKITTYQNFHPVVGDSNGTTVSLDKVAFYYYMSHNNLGDIPKCFFFQHVHIEVLDLSFNLIPDIPQESCLGRSVKTLDLSNNKLTKLHRISHQVKNVLRILLLERNKIEQINQDAFSGLEDSVKTVDLRNNHLTYISNELMKFRALEQLLLSGNPLICACNVFQDHMIREIITEKMDYARCQSPPSSRGYIMACVLGECLESSETLPEPIEIMCKKDDFIGFEFAISPNENGAEVSWIVFGPRKYSGVRLTATDDNIRGVVYNRTLHFTETKLIISNMTSNHSYIICIQVLIFSSATSANELCDCSSFFFLSHYYPVEPDTSSIADHSYSDLVIAFGVVGTILTLGNLIWLIHCAVRKRYRVRHIMTRVFRTVICCHIAQDDDAGSGSRIHGIQTIVGSAGGAGTPTLKTSTPPEIPARRSMSKTDGQRGKQKEIAIRSNRSLPSNSKLECLDTNFNTTSRSVGVDASFNTNIRPQGVDTRDSCNTNTKPENVDTSAIYNTNSRPESVNRRGNTDNPNVDFPGDTPNLNNVRCTVVDSSDIYPSEYYQDGISDGTLPTAEMDEIPSSASPKSVAGFRSDSRMSLEPPVSHGRDMSVSSSNINLDQFSNLCRESDGCTTCDLMSIPDRTERTLSPGDDNRITEKRTPHDNTEDNNDDPAIRHPQGNRCILKEAGAEYGSCNTRKDEPGKLTAAVLNVSEDDRGQYLVNKDIRYSAQMEVDHAVKAVADDECRPRYKPFAQVIPVRQQPPRPDRHRDTAENQGDSDDIDDGEEGEEYHGGSPTDVFENPTLSGDITSPLYANNPIFTSAGLDNPGYGLLTHSRPSSATVQATIVFENPYSSEDTIVLYEGTANQLNYSPTYGDTPGTRISLKSETEPKVIESSDTDDLLHYSDSEGTFCNEGSDAESTTSA